ncbi:MAG: hypothetical protein RL481_1722, partial [Pseudomonadota bacterium]
MADIWPWIFRAREELLLFSAFWFLVGGADDLLVDLIWIGRGGWRRVTRYRSTPPMSAEQLPKGVNKAPLAILIPAWKEAAVIGPMLLRCEEAWRESGITYNVYVGCYRNDPATISAILTAARFHSCIHLVLCDTNGPTTKADCLNRLWKALTADELAGGFKYKAVVLHDAEDYVHPLELRIFDYLIERSAAVQLPVIPVQVPGSAWISGHYCDEFAEAHGKSLVVREAMGAAVPLAGVGCAVERNRLGRIAIERHGLPFDAESLTEDYELGLGLGADGGKVIFARLRDGDGKIVGTHACFPETFEASTRQKARWMTGIALAGWDRTGWRGGIAEIWMRIRDRKAVFAAFVLTAAYLCVILSVVLIALERSGLFSTPPSSRFIQIMLLATLALLVWRIAMRCAMVWSIHGPKQALLSVPRSFVANIIAIAAARRACVTYLRLVFGGRVKWDKTA